MQPRGYRYTHRKPRAHLHHRTPDVPVRQRVVVGASELGGMNDGTVEQDLKLEGCLEPLHSADRAAGGSPQLRANLILGIRGEVVIDGEPAAASIRQPFDPVVLREV